MAALEALVRKHRGPIVHYLCRMVRNMEAAEELAQEVFLRVYRHREGYQATAKFTTWLYSIAGHLALNWLRDHRHERTHERLDLQREHYPMPQLCDPRIRIDEWLLIEGRINEVRRAVGELPERQRVVVILHKFEGVGCIQIARALGCSHQSVRSLLYRAYATLRLRLEEFESKRPAEQRTASAPAVKTRMLPPPRHRESLANRGAAQAM
ncbi:MAG: RNA polymerase sigma factor [Bryobacteraceae bacterium]